MRRKYSTQELLDRWEDRREVQNLMGRFSQSYTIKEEGLIYDRFWSSRDDVCLGINEGWYDGRDAVKGYYDALYQRNVLASRLIKDYFKGTELDDKSYEECLGVGRVGYKPVDTCVVEVAGDGATAKGIWTVRGGNVELESTGLVSYVEFSYLAVDFIKEDDAWKIWHMQNLFDVFHPAGTGWSEVPPEYEEVPEFAELKGFEVPQPNVKTVLREYYHPMRAFSPSPRLPKPYHTFEETFAYGITREEEQHGE